MDDTPKTKKLKTPRRLGFYLLIVGFICLIIAGVLGLKTFDRVGHRPPPVPRETNVSLIQDWMTIPYIARVYGVPQEELFQKLNLDPQKYSKSNLSKIAGQTNTTTDKLLESIKIIINDFQSSHTKPPGN